MCVGEFICDIYFTYILGQRERVMREVRRDGVDGRRNEGRGKESWGRRGNLKKDIE